MHYKVDVPALVARDQSAVGRFFRRLDIQVEGLGVERPGESDDVTLGQRRTLADEAIADLEIIEVARSHFGCPGT